MIEFSDDFKEVLLNSPPSPTNDLPIEITVVGKRCIYVNQYRIAGSKPYASENLPQHGFTTTLGQVLDAFSQEDVLKALAEKIEQRDYIRRYHKWKAQQ